MKAPKSFWSTGRSALSAALLLASGAAIPSPAAAQIDLLGGLPDIGTAVSNLKEQGLAAFEDCNYQAYLDLGEQLWGQAESAFGGADNGVPGRRWALPYIDVVGGFLNAGETLATKRSAEAEQGSVIYQLEQVCNAATTAAEIERTHDIFLGGRIDIDNALNWLSETVDFDIAYEGGDLTFSANYDEVYKRLLPDLSSSMDTIFNAVDETIRGTLSANRDTEGTLGDLKDEISRLRRSMHAYALPDTTDSGNAWMCPEGYDGVDPNDPENGLGTEKDPTDKVVKPICGPESPERMAQVTAQVNLLTTQIRSIQMAQENRQLEVQSIELMADNAERRLQAAVNLGNLTAF